MEESTKLIKKRLLALVLTIVMVFGMIPGNVIAVEPGEGNGAQVTDLTDESTPTNPEPKVTEPKVTEPKVTEPKVTEPEVTEPEVTEPKVTEPEATEPEVTEPDATEPDATEPEATEPETTEPETTEPEEITYGKVATYTGGVVSGNETDTVTVTITEVTLQWHEADASVGRTEGWWVGISATAPENVTAEELAAATYTVDGGNPKSFATYKDGDRYIQLWYSVTPERLAKGTDLVKTYVFDWDGTGERNQTIKFIVKPSDKIVLMKDGVEVKGYNVNFAACDQGYFTDVDGKKLTVLYVSNGTDAKFGFQLNDGVTGYDVEILDGTKTLTAKDGIYTIAYVTKGHEVKAVLKDVQEPTLSAEVEDAEEWKKAKNIKITAADNSDSLEVFVARNEYITLEALRENAPGDVQQVSGSYAATEEGTYYIYAVDGADHWKYVSVEVAKLDTIQPEMVGKPQIVDIVDANGVATTHYTITVKDEGGSGVHTVYYSGIEEPKTEELQSVKSDSDVYKISWPAGEACYVWIHDYAGNITAVGALPANKVEITDVYLPDSWCLDEYKIWIDIQGERNGVYLSTQLKENVEEFSNFTKLSSGTNRYPATVKRNDTYYVYVVDLDGNWDMSTVEMTWIDNSAPVITSITHDPEPVEGNLADWHNGSVTLTVAIDEVGSGIDRVEYYTRSSGGVVTERQLAVYDETSGTATVVVPAVEYFGSYIFEAFDKVGHVSNRESTPVHIDMTKPEVLTAEYNVDESSSFFWREVTNVLSFDLIFRDNISIRVTGQDEGGIGSSDIVKYQYQVVSEGDSVQDNKWVDYEVAPKDSTSATIQFIWRNARFVGKVYIRAWDLVGNISDIKVATRNDKEVTIVVDSVTPAVPDVNLNGYEANKWTKEDVTITLSGGETASGVKVYQYRIGEDGEWTDMTETTGTQKQKADAFAKVNDQLVFNGDTNAIYYFRAVSNTENVSAETAAVEIKVQKTAPDNAKVEFTPPDETGWYKKYDALEIKLTEPTVDPLAAPVTTYYKLWKKGEAEPKDGTPFDGKTQPDVTEDGIYTLQVWTVDEAANRCEEVIEHTLQVDTTPVAPTVNLNGYKAGKWTNENVTISLSGGDNHISGVKVYQYRIDNSDEWIDMPEKTGEVFNQLVINGNTNAVYYFRTVSNANNLGEETEVVIKVQKDLPDNATVTLAEPNGTHGWYIAPVGADESTRFSAPGIALFEPDVDELAAPVTTYYKLWNEGKGETELEDSIVFNGKNQPVIEADGIYKLKVWTVDEAGNQCEESNIITKTIYIDTTAPTDLKIFARKEGSDVDRDVLAKEENKITFGEIIYEKDITIKLNANDATSDVSALLYQKVNGQSDVGDTWLEYPDAGIKISPNERFVINFKAVDKAGNETVVNSDGIILDNKEPSGKDQEVSPEIFTQFSGSKDEHSGIYNGDVRVYVNIFDPKFIGQSSAENGYYSGLNTIRYTISADDYCEPVTKTLWTVGGEDNTGDAVPDGDGLVPSWSGYFDILAEEFNSNNVSVTVTAIDNAGNSNTIPYGPIKIDVSKPEISVDYNDLTPSNKMYYNAVRTATITVKERNWDPNRVIITVTKDDNIKQDGEAYTKTNEYEITEWKPGNAGDAVNGDEQEHTATITYKNDGVYTFDIECTDLAGNGNEGVTSDAEAMGEPFVIDKTQPTVTVTYDNNNAANEKYFKAARTATVTVVEHNFNGANVTIGTDRGGQEPSATFKPGKEKDTYVATIEYKADGDYTFAIDVTDLASNKNKPVDYGTSVAAKEFVIDTTYEDMITIGGVESGKAYGYSDDVIPTINITDINLEDYSVSLVGVQKDTTTDLTEKVNALLKASAENVNGTFDIFEVIQDLDGIYTLSATARDKADNQDTEEVVFTVNRFGSVYVYNDYLVDLIAGGGTYVQNITDDLVIIEYNADKLLEDSLAIEITCDGKPLDNIIYDVTPEMNDKVAVGESGWYQYKYTISKENFTSDGVYKISVSTKDATGNTPENNRYEDMGITFYVDDTPAEISSIVGLEEAIINATEQNVRYTVYDTMGLKAIKVYVDGELIDDITDFSTDMNNYSGDFTLLEKTSAQHVQIVVEDLSGNITDTEAEDFVSAYEFESSVTVSTNIFVRWYANKPLFWGTIGGTSALVAGLWYILASKRKKKEAAAK